MYKMTYQIGANAQSVTCNDASLLLEEIQNVAAMEGCIHSLYENGVARDLIEFIEAHDKMCV